MLRLLHQCATFRMSEVNTTQVDSISLDTVSELKRKLKSQAIHFSNEKLLLEHKNELLRQELIELKEREINQAKLHESMFNKSKVSPKQKYKYIVMNQTQTDPNEFINKQLELLKTLNTQELENLKKDILVKDIKIKELTHQLAEQHEKLNKTDRQLIHKSREMELTIRELELNLKMLEEDKDRVENENTFLANELRNESMAQVREVKVDKISGESKNIMYLRNKVKEQQMEHEQAIAVIGKLDGKSRKLEGKLQKAHSVNTHNIMLLQTQFEKEQNKWEQERSNLQQEIYGLKKTVANLHHCLQKYQHNELLLNASCFSCAYSQASNNMFRMPFGMLNQ